MVIVFDGWNGSCSVVKCSLLEIIHCDDGISDGVKVKMMSVINSVKCVSFIRTLFSVKCMQWQVE